MSWVMILQQNDFDVKNCSSSSSIFIPILALSRASFAENRLFRADNSLFASRWDFQMTAGDQIELFYYPIVVLTQSSTIDMIKSGFQAPTPAKDKKIDTILSMFVADTFRS